MNPCLLRISILFWIALSGIISSYSKSFSRLNLFTANRNYCLSFFNIVSFYFTSSISSLFLLYFEAPFRRNADFPFSSMNYWKRCYPYNWMWCIFWELLQTLVSFPPIDSMIVLSFSFSQLWLSLPYPEIQQHL